MVEVSPAEAKRLAQALRDDAEVLYEDANALGEGYAEQQMEMADTADALRRRAIVLDT